MYTIDGSDGLDEKYSTKVIELLCTAPNIVDENKMTKSLDAAQTKYERYFDKRLQSPATFQPGLFIYMDRTATLKTMNKKDCEVK